MSKTTCVSVCVMEINVTRREQPAYTSFLLKLVSPVSVLKKEAMGRGG